MGWLLIGGYYYRVLGIFTPFVDVVMIIVIDAMIVVIGVTSDVMIGFTLDPHHPNCPPPNCPPP